jgi:ketosteroid isomerase-like protein
MSENDLRETILACERARCAALLAGNQDGLAELLSDRLVFVHANATSDTKSSLLAKMAGGSIVYRTLVVDQETVVGLSGGTAILSARLTADLLVRGEPKRVSNLALSVWTREDDRWRLVAYQPTPIPG